jgi:hypothetical protein
MRRLIPILAGALLIGAAGAEEKSAPDRVIVPASRPAATPYFIWPDDLHDYKGEYYLSNGKRMYISRIGNRLYAQIGKLRNREIRPTAEHQFEAVDGTMSLTIVISRQGYVSGRIAYVDEEIAGNTIVMTGLAMR